MLNMELTSYGLDDTLTGIMNDLESALGRSYSKKQKDEVICKTLGAVNTLWNMIRVIEVSTDTESESDTQNNSLRGKTECLKETKKAD